MSKFFAMLSVLILQLLITRTLGTRTFLPENNADGTILEPENTTTETVITTAQQNTSSNVSNSNISNSSINNNSKSYSKPMIAISTLGDGTCNPPCLNGGYCSFSMCYCTNYTTGTQCQEKIDDDPRYHAAVYLAICLSTFVLGILSAFCCRMAYDQHQETYEQDELRLEKKRRDVLKFGSIPSAAVKLNGRH